MLTIRSRGFGCGEKIIARCLVKYLNVGVVVITTAQLHSSKSELRFKSCSWRVGESRWLESLTMAPAGNKAKRFSSVNYTTKTILIIIKSF